MGAFSLHSKYLGLNKQYEAYVGIFLKLDTMQKEGVKTIKSNLS